MCCSIVKCQKVKHNSAIEYAKYNSEWCSVETPSFHSLSKLIAFSECYHFDIYIGRAHFLNCHWLKRVPLKRHYNLLCHWNILTVKIFVFNDKMTLLMVKTMNNSYNYNFL